jgi:hypothetical protein
LTLVVDAPAAWTCGIGVAGAGAGRERGEESPCRARETRDTWVKKKLCNPATTEKPGSARGGDLGGSGREKTVIWEMWQQPAPTGA